jgi:hypothetical protein
MSQLRCIPVLMMPNLLQVLPATLRDSLLAAGATPDAVLLLQLLWLRSEIGRETCKGIAQPLCCSCGCSIAIQQYYLIY